jgi:hypothetical protein
MPHDLIGFQTIGIRFSLIVTDLGGNNNFKELREVSVKKKQQFN